MLIKQRLGHADSRRIYMWIHKFTGEVAEIGQKVFRINPNKNGFKPKAEIVHLPDDGGAVVLRFAGPNDRPTSPGLYGLQWVVGEHDYDPQ